MADPNELPPKEGHTNTAMVEVNMSDVQKDAPPQYTDPPQYSDAPPPSYDTIMGKVRKAKEESTGNVDYAMKVFALTCCGAVCGIIIIAISFAIPVAHITIGSMYLRQCTIERYIPIYLIVTGCFGIVNAISKLVHKCLTMKCDDEDGENNEKKQKKNPVDGVIGCFLMAWFIAGSVWIFQIYKEVDYEDPLSSQYCHQTLYLYAFWTQIVSYILLALGLLVCCFACGVMCCVAATGKCDKGSDTESCG